MVLPTKRGNIVCLVSSRQNLFPVTRGEAHAQKSTESQARVGSL
jgi:hypothetical protein